MNNNNNNHNHTSKVNVCGGKVCHARRISNYVNNKSVVHTWFSAILCTPCCSNNNNNNNNKNNNNNIKSSWANYGTLLLVNLVSLVSLRNAILKHHNVHDALVDNLIACLGPNLMVDLGGVLHAQK